MSPDHAHPSLRSALRRQAGRIKAGWGCLLFLVGIPLPIVLLLMFMPSC